MMVGLVLVSHSRAVAVALQGMVGELYGGSVPVAVAAGAGEDGALLGTDATAIMAAVEELATTCDGVLVLLDLGSAILSAEMALELLDEATRAKVAVCGAPLVEGAVAAAAQCSIGAALESVRAEAEGALRQKTEHLGGPGEVPAAAEAPATDLPGAEERQTDLLIENASGLHARPAMRIVQTAAGFRSTVEMRNLRTGGAAVSARSLVALTCLDARRGDSVRVSARGEDAAAAIRAMEALHAERFGDPPGDHAPAGEAGESAVRRDDVSDEPTGTRPGAFRGKALSAGCAVGPLVVVTRATPTLPPMARATVDPTAEMARLRNALDAVRGELAGQIAVATQRFGAEQAAILEVQRTLAADPALVATAEGLIHDARTPLPAEHAWQRACQAAADAYRHLADPLLRERAGDVEDLEERVLRALGVDVGADARHLAFDEPGILLVASLRPTEVTALNPLKVLGIVAESVGATSHAAILLRAACIPVVDGVAVEALRGAAGKTVALDGDTGEWWIDPDAELRAAFEERRRREVAERDGEAGALPAGPVRTRDGRRVELAANAASVAEARAAVRAGAEGIGLLRTEFLFLDRADAPTEDEQTEALRTIAGEFPPGAPVTVRTLDIGGDKPVPFLPTTPEENPFLGVRGLRLTLRTPGLFVAHLRAILRAGHGRKFRVMFPMVTAVEEIRRARALLSAAHEQLVSTGQEHAWPMETGMMIEVPGAALLARRFAPEVDFFSVGTNDLTQYTLAAERGHQALENFSDAMHPAVLRLISLVTAAARRYGKWVGVCGEAAADPVAAGAFVGLGVDELSVGAGALRRVRRVLTELDAARAQVVARRCLRAEDAEAARAVAAGG